VHHDAEKPIDAKDNGVFFLNSAVRYDDVEDGASNTLFLGEKLPDAWDFEWMSGTRGSLRNMGSMINSLEYNKGLPQPRDAYPSAMAVAIDPATGEVVVPPEEEVELPPVPFDAPPGFVPGPGGVVPGNPLYVGGFGSQHPGCALFACGDGSIRYISETISPTLYANLANRRDGKLPEDF
jgi:hypothetical protein